MKPVTEPINASDTFDDESALGACVRGDPEALRAVYDREARWLLGVALRIVRDRETAHNVLQDAFQQIWQRAGSYRRALGSARGWIYTVVRHRALDEVRRAVREIAVGDEIEGYAETQLGADRPQDAAHADVGMLPRCLGALDEHKRESIV